MRPLPLLLVLLLSISAQTLHAQIPFLKKDKPDDYELDHTTWVYPPWKHTWGIVRATQTHLTLFTLGRAKFVNPQGLAVVRLKATNDPDERSDDDEVTVYGVNTGENSIIYNRSMQSIALYGYGNLGVGNLDQPWDVAATAEGLLFVTDSGNRRVVKFRNVEGDLVYVSSFGRGEPANLKLPRGIAVTGGGMLVVADAGSDRVVLFDTSGVFQGSLDGFETPLGMEAIDAKSSYTRPREEYIVVSDSGGARISKIRFDGEVLARVRVPDVIDCPNPPHVGHLTTDIFHNVVATDSSNDRILKFDPRLRLLDAWGQSGKGRSRFNGPTGIAIWRRFGQTFVAEQSGAHYLWVGVDLIRPPVVEVEEHRQIIRVQLALTERARVQLELLDGDGNILRKSAHLMQPYDASINWLLGRSFRIGRERQTMDDIKQGEYTLRMRIRPTYSSRKVFERVVEQPVILPEPE